MRLHTSLSESMSLAEVAPSLAAASSSTSFISKLAGAPSVENITALVDLAVRWPRHVTPEPTFDRVVDLVRKVVQRICDAVPVAPVSHRRPLVSRHEAYRPGGYLGPPPRPSHPSPRPSSSSRPSCSCFQVDCEQINWPLRKRFWKIPKHVKVMTKPDAM
jgi:hypothetical protein